MQHFRRAQLEETTALAEKVLHLEKMLADLEIELDEERRLRGCLENELAQKDGGLNAVYHCDKDNTWRRSLGGNSVDSDESTRVPDNEAAKPEVFDISTDSEDEAEVSPSDLKSLDQGSSPLTEPSAKMPRRSENWRLHCGAKSDKQTYVAEADSDSRNGQALSTFHPVACAHSKSHIEDSVHNCAAFGKDEAACEQLLMSDCTAEHEAISAADDIFTIVLELCKQDLSERTLTGTPSGTKSPTVGKKLERHLVSDMELEDDLEEQDASDASDASSPGEDSDRNSLQTDFLGEEVPDEMMQLRQIEHQGQVQVVQEQDGFLPQELWPRLLSFLQVSEVMKMQTRAVSHFFSDSKAWVAHLVQLMDLDALPTNYPTHRKDPVWKHPVSEFLYYCSFLVMGQAERATEMNRDASEGFQGYRIWFRGLYRWHTLCPEMILDSVEVIMQHYGSTVGEVPRNLFWGLIASGIRQIRLPMTKGLLPVLCSKDLELDAYKDALKALDTCRSVFHHLTPACAAELLESVTSWTDKELQFSAIEQVIYLMEGMLDDKDLCIANHYMDAMAFASRAGRMDSVAANKQKVVDLLMESKDCS
eukprot:Skav214952  [mRNA]  locus=scaffold2320:94618:96387:+ [translate_table: standard]